MTTEPDPIDAAVEQLFNQFSVLANVGYSGGPMAGEHGLFRLTVPFTGRVMEGITVISNLPVLPYGASPTRVVQDAVFKWLYVLTHELQKHGPELEMLQQNYRWELRMIRAAEEGRQLRLFREFLAEKAVELRGGGDTLALLRELREVASEAPQASLRFKCTKIVAESADVRKAVSGMTADAATEFENWLEPHVY